MKAPQLDITESTGLGADAVAALTSRGAAPMTTSSVPPSDTTPIPRPTSADSGLWVLGMTSPPPQPAPELATSAVTCGDDEASSSADRRGFFPGSPGADDARELRGCGNGGHLNVGS